MQTKGRIDYYYVIQEKGSNFHRAARYQASYKDGDWQVPSHYWDVETEEIVIEQDAIVKFTCNDKWLAEDTVSKLDKEIGR